MIATAIVWDYQGDEVLLLTNYHTWDSAEFRYCFPPPTSKISKRKRKRANSDDSCVGVKLQNEGKSFEHSFSVTSDIFMCWDQEHDFTVLKLPRSGFTMARIPIHLGLYETMNIHAFGFIGHTGCFNITGGEVTGFIPEGFTMNILSAPGFSGAAILSDGIGRAVGFMGGNLDSSKERNSQHQAYGYRLDRVVEMTGRQEMPTSSPESKVKPVARKKKNNKK